MLAGFSKIRIRLTAWYTAIFGIVLLGFICAASILHYLHLRDQLYHAEIQDMETVEGMLSFDRDGRLLLHDDYLSEAHRQLLDRLLEVLTPDGRILLRNGKLAENTLGGSPSPAESSVDFFRHDARLPDGTPVLVISHVRPVEGQRLLIRIGYSLEPIRRQSIQLFLLLLLVMPFALLAAGFAGSKVASKVLDPLENMAQLTEHITAHKLDQRIPVKNPNDELGHMALVLNNLLERLETSFQQLRSFTSDVSHELRTPLASIRSIGEVGVQADYDAARYRDIIGSMLEEVGRLTSMVDTLLTIAHAESGSVALKYSRFAARDLVEEVVFIVRALAEDKGQDIALTISTDRELHADRSFLRIALMNLLDNAIKYSPANSRIGVFVSDDADGVVKIEISDEGPGIPLNERERIFDRFYRLEGSRNRETGGVGLGLAIAKWAVEAHGGLIGINAIPGGRGATFFLHLLTEPNLP